MDHFKKRLLEGLELLSVPANSDQVDKFVRFAELLLKWNKVYNLTAITNEEDVLTKHLLDSVTLFPFVQAASKEKSIKVLDVGCGGGLPGIPLAILLPEISFDLIDTVNKKIVFVRQAGINLGLKNLNAINQRVENYQPDYSYDLISCRAFSSLPDFVRLTEHLISEEGSWLAMKGKVPSDEIKELPKNVQLSEIIELNVPFIKTKRNLIVIKRKK